MEFDRARRVGDEGERQVSQRLRSLAPRYGFEFRDKVLLKRRGITAECDHILVDRFGILIIETKVRNAMILGTSTDKTWTAMYHGKGKKFQNPLLQNMQHQSIVRQVLSDAGEVLSADQVKRAVVFVGADLSRLDLEAADTYRVKDVEHLEEILSGRDSFPPNDGCLGPDDVARIVTLVDRLNQAGEAAVEDAHAAYRGGAIPSGTAARSVKEQPRAHAPHGSGQAASKSSAAAPSLTAAVPGGHRYSNPSTVEFSGRHYQHDFSLRPFAYFVAGVLAVALLGWIGVLVVVGVSRMTPVGWLVVLVAGMIFLQALLPSGRGRARGRARAASASSGGFGRRLVAIAVAGLMFLGLAVFFSSGAADRVIQAAVAMMAPKSTLIGSAPGALPASAPTPGLPIAKARLKESNPKVYSAASNLDSPQVKSNSGGTTSYTWTYVQKVNQSTVRAVLYTLTLDISGRVIGVNSTL